ncbi:MAG: hypothetical protein AAF152_16315 [Cyanobacteria bacterium P01_A01_bin.114]
MSDKSTENETAENKSTGSKPTDTVNPGDRIDPSASLEEKREQVAVKYEDVTMNTVEVPTYFMVEGESGEEKALHHVEDAEEISDVIRQARVNEDGERTWA